MVPRCLSSDSVKSVNAISCREKHAAHHPAPPFPTNTFNQTYALSIDTDTVRSSPDSASWRGCACKVDTKQGSVDVRKILLEACSPFCRAETGAKFVCSPTELRMAALPSNRRPDTCHWCANLPGSYWQHLDNYDML